MARRATTVTKGRTTPNKTTAAATPEAAKPSRRGKAKPQDETPIEMPSLEAAPDDAPAPAAETPAPKPRRGRKSKVEMGASDDAADFSAGPADTPVEPPPAAEEISKPERPEPKPKAPKPPSTPRMTRRNREPEASAPPPVETAEDLVADTPIASAVHWHAETGTVTFDWPTIEQVAAAEGVNQPMAKLLLAARAEGARSRWPF